MDRWELFELLLLLLKSTYLSDHLKLLENNGQEVRILDTKTDQEYYICGDFSQSSVTVIRGKTGILDLGCLTLTDVVGRIGYIKDAFRLVGSPTYIGCNIKSWKSSYYFRIYDRIYNLDINMCEKPKLLSVEECENVFDLPSDAYTRKHEPDEIVHIKPSNTKSART